MGKQSLFIILLIAMGLFFTTTLSGEKRNEPNVEYQLKAVMISRTFEFIQWPDDANVSNLELPFVITVLGKNPFVNEFKKEDKGKDWLTFIINDRKIKGKSVDVRYTSEINEIVGSNAVFISKSEKKRIADIVTLAEKNRILMIGDTDGYAEKGVHVNFYKETNRGLVKFEANYLKMLGDGFKVASKFLNLAKIVKSN